MSLVSFFFLFAFLPYREALLFFFDGAGGRRAGQGAVGGPVGGAVG